ncbi:MAG: hypothetical protein ACI87E_003158 [Mariniblastus sp.]|jgi:hypothetical protein
MNMIMSRLMLVLAVAALAGCNLSFNSGVKGSGVSKSEARDAQDFQEIELEGVGTVNVNVGQEFGVEITTDDNLLVLIETTVKDGVLTIRTKESISPTSDLIYEISLPTLSKVKVSGAASIDLRDVAGSTLEIEVNGASTITGTGTVDDLGIEVNGASSANLKQLMAKRIVVEMSGASESTIFASEQVDAEVNGVGSVSIHGSPATINKEVNGIGSVSLATK